jgi:anti-sigma regulatory factor (Ser/Thr protein kinase)
MNLMRFSLLNDVAELRRLNDSAAQFLRASSVPASSIHDVQLVLEEVVTNVIRHAWPEGGRHSIEVEVVVGTDGVQLRVEDQGRAFDPTSAPEEPLPAALVDREAGGLGLRLVRRTATAVRYRRDGGRNILELKVPLAGTGPVSKSPDARPRLAGTTGTTP